MTQAEIAEMFKNLAEARRDLAAARGSSPLSFNRHGRDDPPLDMTTVAFVRFGVSMCIIAISLLLAVLHEWSTK